MEKVKISNSDGKSIAAVIHFPENKTEKLAILCPGYLDSKDYNHLVGLAEALAEKGYTVVRFDPTGIWESEGSIADYTNSQYLKDIKSVLEYTLSKRDYRHILLGGHSRGGIVSIIHAAKDSRISVVLGIMPSSGGLLTGEKREQWEKNGVSISERDMPGKTKKREFRVPYSYLKDKDQYDVVGEVKKVHVPLLLVAGRSDTLVLPESVKRIFDSANEPKKIIIIPGIGHDYRFNLSEVKIVNDEILKYLSSNQ